MDGTPMKIGGREFVVPPASMKTAKTVLKALRTMPEVKGSDGVIALFDACASIFVAGLRGNYPEITAEDLEELLPGTVAGVQALMPPFFEAMGFEKPSPGEAQGR